MEIENCPTLYPTWKEFKNFYDYVEKVDALYKSRYGMVKVPLLHAGPPSCLLFLLSDNSGGPASGMEIAFRGVLAASRAAGDRGADRAEHLREERSVRVPAHPEKVHVLQGVQGEDGRVRSHHRGAACRCRGDDGNHETIVVLEKYCLLATALRG